MVAERTMRGEFHSTIWERAKKRSFLGVRTTNVIFEGIVSLESFETVVVVAYKGSGVGMCCSVTNYLGFIPEEFTASCVFADKLLSIIIVNHLKEIFWAILRGVEPLNVLVKHDYVVCSLFRIDFFLID